jgi:hypothetical protein
MSNVESQSIGDEPGLTNFLYKCIHKCAGRGQINADHVRHDYLHWSFAAKTCAINTRQLSTQIIQPSARRHCVPAAGDIGSSSNSRVHTRPAHARATKYAEYLPPYGTR